uniref:MSP domain-containing protein n=1 Tax=Steinernema glaseri TaxID=37863 RepID=A0A1I7Y9V1_9BILA
MLYVLCPVTCNINPVRAIHLEVPSPNLIECALKKTFVLRPSYTISNHFEPTIIYLVTVPTSSTFNSTR